MFSSNDVNLPKSGYSIVLSSFSLTNPVYNINNGSERCSDPKNTFDLGRVTLERKNLPFWNTQKIELLEIRCQDYNSVKNAWFKDSFLEIQNVRIEAYKNDPNNQPLAEQYFANFPQEDIKVKDRKINLLTQFQKNQTVAEIQKIIGYADRAFASDESEALNLWELQYKVVDGKVDFVSLAFDKNPSNYPDAKLQKIVLTNKDRTSSSVLK